MKHADNSDLFIAIVEANKGILYKIANAYTKDQHDRNDLLQEMILRLWKGFANYNSDYKHSTWMYRIALNTAISVYRKDKVREKHFAPLTESLLEFEDLHRASEAEEKHFFLQQLISELKELDKALMLLYLEEKTHKEIAAILGISESNVGTKINRLKNFLKTRMLNKTF